MKIYVSTNRDHIDIILKKLFGMGYTYNNIIVLSYENLNEVCKFYNIKFIKIIDNTSLIEYFSENKYNDLFINVSGIPFRVNGEIIKKFSYKMINYHSGILEQYRGRWPVSWALIDGKKQLGYTWHFINDGFDTGNILYQKKFKINNKDTAFSLNHKLINHAISKLHMVIKNSAGTGKKPKALGKYYSKKIPHNGVIDPQWDSTTIDRFIRAMYYPPYAPAKCIVDGIEHHVCSYENYVLLQK